MPKRPALALLLGFLLACSGSSNPPVESTDVQRNTDASPPAFQVQYLLSWGGYDRIDMEEDGSWSIQNDLGYFIHLKQGYLVSYSSELIECTEAERPPDLSLRWDRLLEGIMGVAYAGHSELEPNPAAVKAPLAERLTPPENQELGSVLIGEQFYCKVHYLAARADEKAQWIPSDPDLNRQTLFLKGTFIEPGRENPQSFEIISALGNGVVSPLYPQGRHGETEATFVLESAGSGATVAIERDLPSLFDQLDFSFMSDEQLARQTLKNLVNEARIEIVRD